MTHNSPAKSETRNVDVTRVFDAPVALVWKAWTDPQHIVRWWGPDYFTSPSCEADFREGGTTIACMRSPQGQDFYNTWQYQKIVPMERIEYLQNLSDKDGNPIDPVSVGMPANFPKDVQTVLTFKALGDKTEFHVVECCFPEGQLAEYAVIGMEQSLDKMAKIFAEA